MAFGFFDPGSTPEQLKRRREELDFMASRMGRAQNVGQGVGDLITGLAGGFMRRKANVAENSGIEAANSKLSAFDPFGNPSQPPQAPQMSGGEPFPNPALIEAGNEKAPPVRDFGGMNGIPPTKSIPATALLQKPAPVNPSQGVGGLGGLSVRAAGKGWTEVIGPDGKPVRREGARNWRNHNPGNIEYGDFAKNNGAIGTDGRFAVFPTYEAGRKAKENLLFNSGGYRGKTIAGAISRYAPQFENDTGGYISQVAQAIGVSPNTPLASLNPQQRTAMLDAMQRVEGFKVGRETIGGKPVQVASNDPQFIPASAPPQDVSQETMQPQQPMQQQPQQVAQAQGQPDTARLQEMWKFMNSDSFGFLDANKQDFFKSLWQQELQKQDPAYQMQLQAAQQGLTKGQLEIDAMRNPAPEKPNPTDDMREFDLAQKNPAFAEYLKNIKAAGATQVNNNMGDVADGELRKKLQGKEGEAWAGYSEAATVSSGMMQDMQVLDELIQIAPQGPIQGRLAQMLPGFSSAGDAFQSVIKRVAPTLRAPGSGATSDIEYDGMLKSLPTLSNKPEANVMILQVMKAKAQVNIERGEVVAAYSDGRLTAPQAREKMAELNKRSIMTPEMKKALLGLSPANDARQGVDPDLEEALKMYGD